jgi:hypothetical protein
MALIFNEVKDFNQCELYFTGLSAFPDLSSVADLTKAYRDKFGSTFAKGFLFDIETIDNLRAQNGGDISGIRVYMGLDNSTGVEIPVAVAVAVVDDDDHDIPLLKTEPTSAILAEGRPCPSQCGKDNALNKS